MKEGTIAFMRIIKTALLFCALLQTYTYATPPGKFTAADYERALWMTTRFYGAQRCGIGPNWLIMEHDTAAFRTAFTHDADASSNNYDLEGGWFDCGDHVTFGQTFFYAAYVLAKAYSMFPGGFHDVYHGKAYEDYLENKNWDMSGGTPNGIPDLLEELKYATDWMIKATPDANNFYYQKGEGVKDHKAWVTAGKMSSLPVDSGGEPRKVFKNPNDGVMPSFAAATLAIMSRIYKRYDPDYAQKCLDHARFAFAYAKPRKNSAAPAGDGGFYAAHARPPVVAFITGASEMFKATGEASFKTDAQADQAQIAYHNYGPDYNNTHDLAPLALGSCGIDSSKFGQMKSMFLDQYTKGLNGEGLCTKGNSSWGALRYPANAACLAAFWAQSKKTAVLDTFIFKQVDFILGANNSKQSFIVGFCANCSKEPQHPHHRNTYLRDDNPPDSVQQSMTIPERNKYLGYMVGGTWNSADYKDNVRQYAFTEGGLDYNVGLVGALGYIVSKLDPADTGSFVNVIPGAGRRAACAAHSVAMSRIGGAVQFYLPGKGRMENLSIYDQLGKKLFEKNAPASVIHWKPNVSSGILFVRVRLENREGMTIPFNFLK